MNKQGRDILLTGGLVFTIVVISFLSLWQRARMTQVGYEIQAMQLQKERLMKIHKQLLVEVESVSALDRIEEMATRQLLMIPALPTTRIYIKDRE
jgi:cell division protein FtsL